MRARPRWNANRASQYSEPKSSCQSTSKLQQSFGVAVTDLAEVLSAHRQRVQKIASDGIRAVRIIDGKEDAIRPDHLQGAQKGRHGEVSARGDVEILLEVFADLPFQMLRIPRKNSVSSRNGKRQALSHVPDNDPQFREAVE